MKVLAFSNQKGGVGKTTSAINVGAGLAKRGKSCLLVDLDPQANMTQGLGLTDPEHTVNGILFFKQKITPYKIFENLSLIASDNSLSSFERSASDKIQREFILKKTLQTLQDRYEYIILDCPPAMGMIMINAYTFATDIYVPLEAQKYSQEGLDKVVEMVHVVNEINSDLSIKGIFFTKHNPRKVLSRDVESNIRSTYTNKVLNTFIRSNVALEESPHVNLDIFRYAPGSNGALDYESLVDEILVK